MTTGTEVRPSVNGRVIGLGLGQFRFAGSGVALLLAATLCAPALAGPEGAKVTAGQATINQRGNRTVIRAADRTIIDYTRFNIGGNETVRFIQPSATATVLNRISTAEPTRIDGTLKSNGIVYFANRAGVLFGPTATVNVGGIYAAAGNISNADFLKGMNRFTDLSGEVVNAGKIDAGVAALVGQRVSNTGAIASEGGVIAMVAGNEVILTQRGGTMTVKVDSQTLASQTGATLPKEQPGVENSGTIRAERGRAMMVAGDMYSLAVKNTGKVRAQNIEVRGGKTGMVDVAGTLDTRNQNAGATGGSITVTGRNIHVHDAVIDASGRRAGGDVRIGGDAFGGAGKSDALPTAANVQVDADATIRANATKLGDGGSIVVWSDNRTNFYGRASASGAALGGDGGFIETSGKISLDVRGAEIRAASETGKAGLWLMDPVNVTITNSATTGGTFDGGSPTDTFNPDDSVSPAIVDAATIVAALENGTNVTVTTGSLGSDPGTITVASPIAMTNAPGGSPADPTPTLTLNAASSIDINAAISSSGAALPLNLDLLSGGTVTVAAPITLNGGSFSSTSAVGGFTNTAAISTQGGGVTILHNGTVDLQGAVTTAGGDFAAAGFDFVSTGAGTIDTTDAGGDGDVTLTFSGNVNPGAAIIAASGGSSTSTVTITAATLNPTGGAVEGIDANISAGSGGVTLRPSTASSNVNVGDASGGFDVSAAELGNLTIFNSGAVTVGRADASGTFTIGNTPVNLNGAGYDLTLLGGAMVLNAAITGGNGRTLTLDADSFTDSNGSGVDITIGGISGTLRFVMGGGIGTSGANPLELSVANLGNSTAGGNVFLNNDGALATGSLDVTGNADIRAAGAITQSSPWNITGSTVVWTRADGGAAITLDNAANSFGGTVTLRSRQFSDDTLVAAGPITLVDGGALTIGEVESTGAVSLTADGGIALNNPAAGFVRFGNGLTLTAGSGGAINLPRLVINGGDITFTTTGGTGDVTLGSLNTSTAAFTVNASSAAGGDLDLTSGFGDLTVPSITIGGDSASFATTENNRDITVANLTGPTMFSLSTVSGSNTGNATLGVTGDMILTSAVQGTLTLGSGGDMTVTSSIPLRIATAVANGFANFTAPDMIISGPISAGSGGILLQPVNDADTIGLNTASGDFQLTEAELQNLSTSGTVTIGRSTGTGLTTVGGIGAIDLSGTTYNLTLQGGQVSFTNGLTLANDTLMTFLTAGIASPGSGTDVTIGGTNGRVLIDTSAASTLTTSVAVVAGRTSAGRIDITNAGALEIGSIGMIDGLTAASDGDLSVTTSAGDLTLSQAVTASGTGVINLTSDAGSVVFNSGSSATADSGSTITISADQNITAPASMATLLSAGTLSLTAANGSIGNGNTVRTAAATIVADGETGIDITNTGDLSATLTAANGQARLDNTGTLATGAAWSAQSIDVDTTGDITIAHNVTGTGASGVAISSSAGTLTVGNGATVSSSDNVMTLNATDLILTGTGSLDSGLGAMTITQAASGKVFIGDVTAATGSDMALSNAELENITSANLTLGGANTTEIVANGVTGAATANLTLLTLDATANGAKISFTGGDSTFKALTANADDGIAVDASITATGGALSLDGDADNAADTNDRIAIAAGRTISTSSPSGGAITLKATTGGIVGAGELTIDSNAGMTIASAISAMGQLTLRAKGGITLAGTGAGQGVTISADDGVTLSDDVTNSSGSTIINADANADGTGTLTLATGKTITTGGNNLAITANDLALDGSINAGVGSVSIARSTAGTIGLGSGSGDMSITDAELGRITAAGISIGNNLTTLMTVDSVSAMGTANIANLITLLANDINIAGAFNTGDASLAIGRPNTGTLGVGNASGDMTISGAELMNITTRNLTLGGGLTQNIIVNGVTAAQSMGIAGTTTFISGNTLTFSGASNTFNAINARADNGINVNSNLTASGGNLALDGDSDNASDGNDGITIGSNRTLSSAGLMTLRAATGGISGLGSLTLNADSGITLFHDLTSSGVTMINADFDADNSGTLNIASGRTVSTSGNTLTISAADLVLDGSINTGASNAVITRSGSGVISLGTATGGLTISGAEFGRIIATGLTIGSSTVTGITAAGLTNANTNGIAGTTTLETGAAGTITFDGTNVFNSLVANAGAGLTVNGALSTDTGNLTLDGDHDNSGGAGDVITLKANVTAPAASNAIFNSKVVLGSNLTVSGRDITFTDDVNSDSTPRALTVTGASTGVITFGANVGNTARLFTLTVNGTGTTRLSGQVRTTGSIAFNTDIRLLQDSVVDSTGGLGVFFAGNIDTANSSPAARSLTVLTRRNTTETAKNIPTIKFGGSIGEFKALKDLNLNFDAAQSINGRANVPAVATIILRPFDANGNAITNPGAFTAIVNLTGSFVMGQNEKFTTAGGLNLTANHAVFGDVTTVGALTVNAPTVVFNRRAEGRLVGTIVNSADPMGLGPKPDRGVDVVSGGKITFNSTSVTATGTGADPAFSTPGGAGNISGPLSAFLQQAYPEAITVASVNRVETSGGAAQPPITLDLSADGPTDASLATSLAGAIPRESRISYVGQDTTIAQAQIDQLKNLGVFARNPSAGELVSLLSGSATYDDVPRRANPGVSDYTTVVNRLPSERVDALLASYDELFNKPQLDEEGKPVLNDDGTPKRVNRSAEIQQSLFESVRRFRAARSGAAATENAAPRAGTSSFDPLAFRAYLEQTPEESTSLGYVRQIGAFLTQLEELGLTPRELAQAKSSILTGLRPRGIPTTQQFEAVIKADNLTAQR